MLRKTCKTKNIERHKLFKGAPLQKSNPDSMEVIVKSKERSLDKKKVPS